MVPDRSERSVSTPIDARFVAGELDVPSPGERTDPVIALEDSAFVAMGPMLGLRPGSGDPLTTSRYPLLEESTATAKTEILQREPRPAPPTLPPLVPVARPAAPASTSSPSADADTPKVVVGSELRVGTGDDTGP
jgi:hypothetical protein